MKEKERTKEREKEIFDWWEKSKPNARIEYKEEFRKKYKRQLAPPDHELWLECLRKELVRVLAEKRGINVINLTEEEKEKLEHEKEVLKDAIDYCEESIAWDKATR